MELPKTGEFAHIGKSVAIKGDLSGSEDLYIDGQVEGSIELQGSSLTVGPNGQVRANVNAKVVIIHGKLEGNIRASDRAELRKSALTVGDIATQRIAIEDGAYFKGKIEIHKETAKPLNSSISSTASARSSSMPKTAVTETK
jgi:cytoskeletal protein CcmA (bactofilin family)